VSIKASAPAELGATRFAVLVIGSSARGLEEPPMLVVGSGTQGSDKPPEICGVRSVAVRLGG
jgi:hypothetical protein